MTKLKIKFLKMMVAFCEKAESFAPDQEEANWLTTKKKYFLREKQRLEASN